MQLMGATSMPFSIKKSFVTSDVITKPALQKFCGDKKIPTGENKEDLVRRIEDYANESEENQIEVFEWLYDALQYGIRDVYVFPYASTLHFQALISDASEMKKRIQTFLPNQTRKHIAVAPAQSEIGLVDFAVESNEENRVSSISLIFLQLTYHEKRQRSNFTYTPTECVVFVTIDIQNNWIQLLTRPQNSLIQYNTSSFDHNEVSNRRIKSEDIIITTKKQVLKVLGIEPIAAHEAEQYARNAFYHLLKKYTFTPQVIVDMLDGCTEMFRNFATELSASCQLPMIDSSLDKIAQDIKNATEKHISINYSDKSIFIDDRKAYPTKIDVIGSDLSRVEESSVELPLQQTEIFFDNKRFMEDHQECTCLELCYNRGKIKYVSDDSYNVHFSTKRGGWLLKFKAYTLKEEIQYVLRDVIEASS